MNCAIRSLERACESSSIRPPATSSIYNIYLLILIFPKRHNLKQLHLSKTKDCLNTCQNCETTDKNIQFITKLSRVAETCKRVDMPDFPWKSSALSSVKMYLLKAQPGQVYQVR